MLKRPNLFSDTRVFVAEEHLDFMARLIRAVERVAALPAWRERVLAYAPQIARHEPRAAGVFFGYDFHLDAAGPRLIEINTNAGGGLFNARLLGAQIACCRPQALGRAVDPRRVEDGFVSMFRNEWRLLDHRRARGTQLRRQAPGAGRASRRSGLQPLDRFRAEKGKERGARRIWPMPWS
jgi:hypothetical protein